MAEFLKHLNLPICKYWYIGTYVMGSKQKLVWIGQLKNHRNSKMCRIGLFLQKTGFDLKNPKQNPGFCSTASWKSSVVIKLLYFCLCMCAKLSHQWDASRADIRHCYNDWFHSQFSAASSHVVALYGKVSGAIVIWLPLYGFASSKLLKPCMFFIYFFFKEAGKSMEPYLH